LPTIAGFALKNGTKYLNIGNNLLDTLNNNSNYFSYNERMILSPENQDKDSLLRKVEARQTLLRLYYQNIFSK
jgi:hypothetical protein